MFLNKIKNKIKEIISIREDIYSLKNNNIRAGVIIYLSICSLMATLKIIQIEDIFNKTDYSNFLLFIALASAPLFIIFFMLFREIIQKIIYRKQIKEMKKNNLYNKISLINFPDKKGINEIILKYKKLSFNSKELFNDNIENYKLEEKFIEYDYKEKNNNSLTIDELKENLVVYENYLNDYQYESLKNSVLKEYIDKLNELNIMKEKNQIIDLLTPIKDIEKQENLVNMLDVKINKWKRINDTKEKMKEIKTTNLSNKLVVKNKIVIKTI
jgi:hypothetical protein